MCGKEVEKPKGEYKRGMEVYRIRESFNWKRI